jgi:hypothetical protein
LETVGILAREDLFIEDERDFTDVDVDSLLCTIDVLLDVNIGNFFTVVEVI